MKFNEHAEKIRDVINGDIHKQCDYYTYCYLHDQLGLMEQAAEEEVEILIREKRELVCKRLRQQEKHDRERSVWENGQDM